MIKDTSNHTTGTEEIPVLFPDEAIPGNLLHLTFLLLI
jgi:hypothetical protein